MPVQQYIIPRGGVTYTLFQGVDEAGEYGPAGDYVDFIQPDYNHPVHNVPFFFRPDVTTIKRTATGGLDTIETVYVDEIPDGNGKPFPRPPMADIRWLVRKQDHAFFMLKLGKAISNSINNGFFEAYLRFSGLPPFNPITGAFIEYPPEQTDLPPAGEYYETPAPPTE